MAGYEVPVGFQDCAADQNIYHVTLTFRRPRNAPGFDAKRIEVWLLASGERKGTPGVWLTEKAKDTLARMSGGR